MRRPRADGTANGESIGDARAEPEVDDPFEEWERYPVDEAEENIGYQKLAWYGAPSGSAGMGLLVLAVITNALRRLGREIIRLLIR